MPWCPQPDLNSPAHPLYLIIERKVSLSDTLLLVPIAGVNTAGLRQSYPFDNVVVEDCIDFGQVMPSVDVIVSKGGYGGVLRSIMNELPMVVGGKYEGKNEICARAGYFGIGINLKTERPPATR